MAVFVFIAYPVVLFLELVEFILVVFLGDLRGTKSGLQVLYLRSLKFHFWLDIIKVFSRLLHLITLQVEVINRLQALLLSREQCVIFVSKLFLGGWFVLLEFGKLGLVHYIEFLALRQLVRLFEQQVFVLFQVFQSSRKLAQFALI